MENKTITPPSIAVIGGSGKEGKLLAYRLAKAGYKIFIGSRSAKRAREISEELKGKLEGVSTIEGLDNVEAAKCASIIVLSVPYSAHMEILEEIRSAIQGKLLIDVTVPLNATDKTKVQMPAAGSAAQEAAQLVGEDVQICTAFQNVSFKNLASTTRSECDVLVTGTSKAARTETIRLVMAAGFNAWDAGPLENSMVVEGLTSILININKQHTGMHAGLKITGLDVETRGN